MFYKKYGKRLTDMVLSAILIVVLFVPCAIAALCLRLRTGRKGIVWLTRVGQNKELFKMAHFRLSTGGFSRFLRAKKLDTLPALLNVFAGNMTLVGIVPALPTDYALLQKRDRISANALRPALVAFADEEAYIETMGFVTDMRRLFGGSHD